MTAGAGVEDTGTERGGDRVGAEADGDAEQADLNVRCVGDPVTGAPGSPDTGAGLQTADGVGTGAGAAQEGDVGDVQACAARPQTTEP